MSDFNVNTIFAAVDKVSKSFKKQSKSAVLFGDKAARAFNKASRSGNKFGGVLKGVLGANLISKGFSTVVRGLRNVINEFIDFDDAVVAASAKFDDMNLFTEKGRQNFKRLTEAAREVGQNTEFTSAQAAKGLDNLALAGFTSEQAIAALPPVVDLATAANIDLAQATRMASVSLGVFDKKSKDTVQLQKNLIKINDLLAATMSSELTTIEEFFDAIAAGGNTFISAGQSMETFAALVGKMAAGGKFGQQAGVLLRNAILRLANPTKEARDVLRFLNVEVEDSHGNFRDMIDVVDDVRRGVDKLGNRQRSAALDIIFGKKAIAGFNILVKETDLNLKNYRLELSKAGGTSKRIADTMRTSLGKRLKALQSASIELGFKILEAFDKRGRKGIDALTAAIRKFDPKPVIEFIEKALVLFKGLFDIIKPIVPFFSQIVKGLIAVKVAMIAVNIAMIANPAGIIIFAIGALIGLLALVVLNWDNVVANFKNGIKVVKNFFIDLWATVKSKFFDFINPVLKIVSRFGKLFRFDTSGLDAIIARTNAQQRRLFIESQGGLRSTRGGNVVAPNLTEIESRQQIGFKGQLNIAGAPQGSTVSSKTVGGPDIDISLSGVNP